ncbi:ATP-binding cassette sub-family A member 7 [Aplysia californica]|uniref:ATP-binding cassette sub-family A member 7 n=1 Tax=Aplysia californica TaxID=6500 RepID=A0ABM1VUW3_APLCA|nr:ATP-binding cassette sub-family A member 7 [Aplysia californica]
MGVWKVNKADYTEIKSTWEKDQEQTRGCSRVRSVRKELVVLARLGEMAFVRQFLLLLWKNFTLRRRQPLRVIVELIWPLVLFFILMSVRLKDAHRDSSVFKPECHHYPRALPSAGALAFLQSYVCNLNDGCVNSSNNANKHTELGANFQDSLLSQILQAADTITSSGLSTEELVSLGKDLQWILSKGTDLAKHTDEFDTGVQSLSDVVVEQTKLRDKLTGQGVGLSSKAVDGLLAAKLDPMAILTDVNQQRLEDLFAVLEIVLGLSASSDISLSSEDEDQIKNLLCQDKILLEYLEFESPELGEDVQSEVCRLNSSQLGQMVEDVYSDLNTTEIYEEYEHIIDPLKDAFGGLGSLTSISTLTRLFEDFQTLSKLDSIAQNLVQSIQDLSWDSLPSPGVKDTSIKSSLGGVLCGRGKSAFNIQELEQKFSYQQKVQDSRGSFDPRFENVKEKIEKKRLDPSCASLFSSFESTMNSRILWRELKPIVLGVITYSPDTPLTRKIIAEASGTFKYFESIVELLTNLEKNLPDLEDFLLKDVSPMQKFLDSPACSVFAEFIISAEIREYLPQEFTTILDLLPNNPCQSVRTVLEDDLSFNATQAYNVLDNVRGFLKDILPYLKCFRLNKFVGYKNARELEEESLSLIGNKTLLAAIAFDNIKPDDTELPSVVKYRIRMDVDRVESTSITRDSYVRFGPGNRYKLFAYWFIDVQDMVDHAIIRLQTGDEGLEMPGVYTQQFPYPCWTENWFAFSMVETMPLFMIISWLFTVAMIIRGIVYEKETRLKEVMRIMGLGNGLHWLAWFVLSLVVMMVSCVILIIMLKTGRLLQRADIGILFFFMLGVCMSTISQCFLISVFFNKANLAAVCGGFIYFILYLPYTQLVQWVGQAETWHFNLACLSSNVAMAMSCYYLSIYEEQVVGAQWGNIGTSPVVDDVYSLRSSILMMYVDALIYLILTWYIEAVFPGQYGMPRKPWFFLQRSYWCGHAKSHSTEAGGQVANGHAAVSSHDIEKEPADRRVGVAVRNLCKVYNKGDKVAVDGLSINFFEGQITSFLGHNGAGKTTTMSILTGLFPPTSGTALIYDQDIHTDFDQIRSSLGMCPQHNVLFDLLTVEEHIWFYALLKGCSKDQVEKELEQMLEDVGLPHKRDVTSVTLSGGMKRKLSVAIAFVGGSRTVILDEPTAGVDPYARRAIWELLLKFKKDRTIILSTHHMDEADVLGDRIAIISHGKLCAVGSSLFLKNRFGSGYYLTLAREDKSMTGSDNSGPDDLLGKEAVTTDMIQPAVDGESAESDEGKTRESGEVGTAGFSVSRVEAFIQKFVPSATLVEDNSMEVCFRLPEDDGHSGKFQKLFAALEVSHKGLGVSSYGVSDTSLEEVFLKVADGVVEEDELCRLNVEEMSENGRYPQRATRNSFVNRFKSSVSRLRRKSTLRTKLISDDDGEENNGETLEEEGLGAESSEGSFGQKETQTCGKLLIVQQLMALIIKRFHHVRRSKKSFICEILLPAAFICLAMVASLVIPPFSEDDPLELQPWMYEPSTGSSSLYSFYNNVNASDPVGANLVNSMLNMPYYGTRCMNPSKHSISHKPCLPPLTYAWSKRYLSQDLSNSSQCSCATGGQVCTQDFEEEHPSMKKLRTNDLFWNMTGEDLPGWLVRTRHLYEQRSFGGFTMGERNRLAVLSEKEIKDVLDQLAESAEGQLDGVKSSDDYWRQLELVLKGGYTSSSVKVWYSNRGFMSPLAYLNAMNNVILRSRLPAGSNPLDYGIVTTNHPFKFTREQFNGQGVYQSGIVDLVVAVCVIFAMSFIPASFVIFLIEERVSKSKHLQMLSGVNPMTYWLGNWIWDMLNYAIPAVLCLLIFVAFDKETYVSDKNLPCLVALLFLYGWAMIPMMYPFSHLFSVPSSAFVLLSCMNVFLGSISTLATFVLDTMASSSLQETNAVLKKIFLVFPHYCLGRGLMDMAYYQLQSNVISRYGETLEYSLFEWNIAGRNIFALVLLGFVFNFINLAIEYRGQIKALVKRKPILKRGRQHLDIDVMREKERVVSGAAASDMLRLQGLTKMYSSPGKKVSLTAVDRLYIGVPKGQCFGLLGVNGAGKTTVFKMLTGDISVSEGDAFIDQHSIKKDLREAQKVIGYCPQFDALDPLLTGQEHLQFYARIKGIATAHVNQVSSWATKRLGLSRYADRVSGSYSGGNKRKLATAIALIGKPSVIFLDEPTTGMDPKARRFLWNCINNIVKSGCSVILTSHSMEECEALCSRLAIMVNGSFQCLGSTQHLKNRFGSGYTITLRVGGETPNLAPAMGFVTAALPTAALKEKHHNMLQYHLSLSGVALSQLFHTMEEAKYRGLLEDFSVSQTTLDQVFINFAKSQADLLDYESQNTPSNGASQATVVSDDMTASGTSAVGVDLSKVFHTNSTPSEERGRTDSFNPSCGTIELVQPHSDAESGLSTEVRGHRLGWTTFTNEAFA